MLSLLHMTDSASFSERHGYHGTDVEITTREDAPEEVRAAVLMLGYAAGMGPGGMRDTICEVLLKRPDPNNWSPGNIENEVHRLIDDAPWYKVYDIAERIHAEIARDDYTGTKQAEYARRLTQFFREHGIGWQMEEGRIVFRGSEAFTLATRDAVAVMQNAGMPTAAQEIHESLKDISRRPNADVTGAIQHAMASLECVAREIDVGHVVGHARVPLVAEHRFPGERLEGQRGDEARCRLAHDHLYAGALFDQQADKLGGLVGGDAAGDAEGNVLII